MTQWFVTRVTWRVPHVVQELPTLPEHMNSPPDIVGSCCLIFSFLCMQCFVDRCLFLSFFLLSIVLSVLPRFTTFDYPLGIFKRFLRGYHTGDNSLKSVERFDHMMFVCRFQAYR